MGISGNIAYNKNKVKNFTDPNSGKDLLIQTGQITGTGCIRNNSTGFYK